MKHSRLASMVLSLALLQGVFPATAQASEGENGPPDGVTAAFAVPGIDLDVTYISREPRYSWDAAKKWPDPGETVTFTAHIVNKGTLDSGSFAFEWQIDSHVVLTGTAASISPQGQATQQLSWTWQTGRHTVKFRADPQNLIAETAEVNNAIEDATDALIIGFWVEQSVYDQFNARQNGAGTYSWEDWAQRIIEKMNWMFEQSRYPNAPQGVRTRVRLDAITLVPDGTLFDLYAHAPSDYNYDGRWGFSVEEYIGCPDYWYDVGWWVIHELGHYMLGRVDLYALNVEAGDVNVLDEEGHRIAGTSRLPNIYYDVVHYTSRLYDIMHVADPYALYSDYHTYSLNRDWPQSQRMPYVYYGWDYIHEIPAETKLRVLDNDDLPMAGVEVSVYQTLPGDGSSGPYSQIIDNTPDITGTTDSQGLFSLGNKPFGNIATHGITIGVALVKLKNPASGQYRYTWLDVIDLNIAYWRGETILTVHDLRFPDGPQRLRLGKNTVAFAALRGTDPIPQATGVEVLGEGVQYWSISESEVPWLRTIPSPHNATSYRSYPPGPLTFIVKSADLPAGTYTTTLTVDAGVGILDSPQTITVTLDVGSRLIHLPYILKK